MLDVISNWPVNRVSELLSWRIILPTEQRIAIAAGNGLGGIAFASVGPRFGVIFIVALMVRHFGVKATSMLVFISRQSNWLKLSVVLRFLASSLA